MEDWPFSVFYVFIASIFACLLDIGIGHRGTGCFPEEKEGFDGNAANFLVCLQNRERVLNLNGSAIATDSFTGYVWHLHGHRIQCNLHNRR